MLLTSDDTLVLYHHDHTERVAAAERERIANHLARADALRRWARRSGRLTAYLELLARVHRARLS